MIAFAVESMGGTVVGAGLDRDTWPGKNELTRVVSLRE